MPIKKVMAMLGFAGFGLFLAACSSSSTSAPSTTVAVTSTTVATSTSAPSSANLYSRFIALNNQLKGDPWHGSQSDAITRAGLDCSGAAKSLFNGLPLTSYPTDLALVKVYCPSKVSLYNS